MVIVTLVKSSTASLLILAVHTAAAVSGQPNKTVETNQQYTHIWTVGLTRHLLHEFAVNILNLKEQDDRIGWKVWQEGWISDLKGDLQLCPQWFQLCSLIQIHPRRTLPNIIPASKSSWKNSGNDEF